MNASLSIACNEGYNHVLSPLTQVIGEGFEMASDVTLLTLERLREVLDYNPETGIFRWKAKTAKRTKLGAIAGEKPARNGYRYISLDRNDHLAQRLAWMFVYGRVPDGYLRFKNNDKLDCRIDNLVEVKFALPESGFDHRSQEGRAAYRKAIRQLNPDKCRESDLKKKFGIDLTQYREMYAAQNGVCAICAKPESAIRSERDLQLAVDHCHKTGKIRGLLCSNCNRGIGCFGDDRERLLNAIAYIDKHAENTS